MVEARFGVAVLPALSLTSLQMDDLVSRPIGVPRPLRRIGIIRRENRVASSAEHAFVVQLKKQIEQLRVRRV
jgi:DNA-binding transcriptional LysR family regulator